MKNFGFLILGFAAISLLSCAKKEEFKLNADNSSIVWKGDYIKDGNLDHSHEGELKFNSGSITVSNGQIVGGEFELNMGSIKELNAPWGEEQAAKLEGHLLSEDYFHVEKFPTAKVVLTGSNGKNVQGTLTVRGVDMPFDVPMTLTTNESGATISGSFELDFSAFKMAGIGGEGEFVSPTIKINVNTEFKK
jgi:polyisoprenoid-binding protein YceI